MKKSSPRRNLPTGQGCHHRDTGKHRGEWAWFLPVFLGTYNPIMQRKIFWLIVVILEVATFWLPLWYQVFAILPIVWIAWWVAYRSDWF